MINFALISQNQKVISQNDRAVNINWDVPVFYSNSNKSI